jgi:hypothetical protein
MSGTAAVVEVGSFGAAPMMPLDEPPELTHEVFLHHMNAMKGHYKSGNSHNGTGTNASLRASHPPDVSKGTCSF